MSENLITRIKALEKREAAKPPTVVIWRGDGTVEIDFKEVITKAEYYRRYPEEKPAASWAVESPGGGYDVRYADGSSVHTDTPPGLKLYGVGFSPDDWDKS